MKTFARSLGLVLASAGTATAVALSSATVADATNKALMVNGIGIGGLPDIVMSNILGGIFGSSGCPRGASGPCYDRKSVPWPMQAAPTTGTESMLLGDSIKVGVTNLDADVNTALQQIGPGDHVSVVGLSAGSLVVDEYLRKLADDPNAPDKSKLNFYVVADSSRIGFNKNRYDAILKYKYLPPVDTKYDTVAVAAEYDGFADFPDRWWNFVAVANAFAGTIVEHVPAMATDLSTVPEENITVTVNKLGGVTTSYLIPAARLPLVQLLPFLEPREAELRKTVESAYIRNDARGGAAEPAAAVAAAATSVADSAVVDNTPVSARGAAEQATAGAVTADATVGGEKVADDTADMPAPKVQTAKPAAAAAAGQEADSAPAPVARSKRAEGAHAGANVAKSAASAHGKRPSA